MATDLMQDTINKGLLIFAIQQQLFCKGCNTILDVDKAVGISAEGMATKVLCAKCFDKRKADLDVLFARMTHKPEYIDGRELKKVRAPK
jgi:RNase P subunit RPR2